MSHPHYERVRLWVEQLEELVDRLESQPPEDGGPALSWLELGRAVLDERHELERLSKQSPEALTDELEARFAEADQELESQLWRLTVLNEHRQRRLAGIPSEERMSTWWYSRGAHLDPGAVTQVGAVAAVAACFPEADMELRALKDAERVLMGHAEPLPLVEVSPFARLTPPSKQTSLLGLGLSAAAALAAALGGFAFHSASERAEKEKAALTAQLADAEANANKEVERLKAQAAMADTMSQAEKDALAEKLRLAELKAQQASQSAAKTGAASAGAAKSSCDPNDPMCGGL